MVEVTAGTTACSLVLTATKAGYTGDTEELSVNMEATPLVFVTNSAPVYPEGVGLIVPSGSVEVEDLTVPTTTVSL